MLAILPWPIISSTAAIVTVALLIAAFVLLVKPLLHMVFKLGPKYRPGQFSVQEWKDLVYSADADQQSDMLTKTDHQTLSVEIPAFLEILKAIEPNIKGEPAQSTYWDIRYKLEQALKQERQG